MFKSIDLFGNKINLNLKGKTLVKTNVGTIITLFNGIFLILVSWFIGNDLIYKSKPITYFQK